MMFIDLLDDDVAQLQDQNTWNTIQDQNWIFFNEQSTMNVELNKIIEWIKSQTKDEQKTN
jgi:hypothetical protein